MGKKTALAKFLPVISSNILLKSSVDLDTDRSRTITLTNTGVIRRLLVKTVMSCLCLWLCSVSRPSEGKALGCVSKSSDEVGHWVENEVSAHDFQAVTQNKPAAAQLWADKGDNIHVVFSRGILKAGHYIAKVHYVNGIPSCLKIVLSAQATSSTELILDTLGDVRFFRSTPFLVIDIPETGVRMRIGSGTWP